MPLTPQDLRGFTPQTAMYCSLADVQARLYSGAGAQTLGQAGTGAPPDQARDAYLEDLIVQLSRRFDHETERNPGNYVPLYDVRLFGGRGAQLLNTDEFAVITAVSQNVAQGQAPNFVDLSGDFASGQMQALPLRNYPKDRMWRLKSFFVDAYRIGNVKLGGIWGCVQPDASQVVPTAPWPGAPSLSQPQLNLLTPDGAGNGWWITPPPVRKAVAEWVVYSFKASQAGYGDIAGSPGSTGIMYRKGIPPEVQMVIDTFRSGSLKLALIGTDGSDVVEERAYPTNGDPDGAARWAGWTTYPGT